MRGRKAQITAIVFIVIILAVVILLVTMFVRSHYYDNLKSKITRGAVIAPEMIPITETVQDCLEQVSIDGVRLIGLQGGVLDPQSYIETEFSRVSYGYDNGEDLASLRVISGELKSFIDVALPLCFNEELFSEFEIELEGVSSSVKIGNKIEIKTSYPFRAVKNDVEFHVDADYETVLDFDLKSAHETAREIINEISKDPEYIHISSLASMDYDVAVLTVGDEYIYSVTDLDGLEGIPYSFMFGVRI